MSGFIGLADLDPGKRNLCGAFAVVIGVCFVVLRLISFVLSGSDEPESHEPEGSETPVEEPGSDV